jgi:hypothetical protein
MRWVVRAARKAVRWSVIAPMLLSVPDIVQAGDVRLGWRPVDGAVGYRLQRQILDLPWQQVADVRDPPADADAVIRHVLADQPLGTVLVFAVSAYDAADRESPPSNPLSLFLAPPTPPASATPTATPRTPSPSATLAPTATVAVRLSGRVTYYAGDAPLADARVTLRGATAVGSTRTALDGGFVVDGSRGEAWQLQVDAHPAGGTAVSALDAAYVLQTIAGTRAFDADQRLACDVTGNGALTALDAALLLQQAVGLIDGPPIAGACAGGWLLRAEPASAPGQRLIAPTVGGGACASGAIAYEPLSAPASRQDFRALLFGDCTGNWHPPGAGLRRQAPDAAVILRPPYERDGGWVVPLAVRSAAPFSALDVRLVYDPTTVAIDEVRAASTARGATVAVRADAGGRVALALASPQPLHADDAILARIRLRADGPPDLRLIAASLDEQAVR